VTVTVYAPVAVDGAVDIVSVEVPDPPAILVLEKEVVKPVVGETLAARFTVPVKPFSGATVTVEVPFAPAKIESDVGLDVKAKSGPVTATRTVRVALLLIRVPDVALIIV